MAGDAHPRQSSQIYVKTIDWIKRQNKKNKKKTRNGRLVISAARKGIRVIDLRFLVTDNRCIPKSRRARSVKHRVCDAITYESLFQRYDTIRYDRMNARLTFQLTVSAACRNEKTDETMTRLHRGANNRFSLGHEFHLPGDECDS